MGSYLNAPATKLLATHCAVCRKSLVDAISVELGIGPDCRKRYFAAADAATEANRPQANKLVYLIAAKQTGPEVLEAVQAVRALGFAALADILVKRLAKVQITVVGAALLLKSPYVETAVPYLAKVPGRRWDKERKVNTYPLTSKGALWDALKLAFPGLVGHGPQGFFTIGDTKGSTPPPPAPAPKAAPVHSDPDDARCVVCNTPYYEEYKAGRGGQWMVSDLNQCCGPCHKAIEEADKTSGGIEAVRARFSTS